MLTAFYYGILSGIGLQAKPSLAGFPCSVSLLPTVPTTVPPPSGECWKGVSPPTSFNISPPPPRTLTLGCAKVVIPSKRKLGWAGRYPWLCGKEQPSPRDD